MNLNFVLSECTFLRSFIPLIIEGNKRKLISNMFLIKSNKYTSPYINNNFKDLFSLHQQYGFGLYDINDLKDYDGITFFVESSGIDYLVSTHKNISITYAIDFISLYDKYINKVDYVLFPSRFFAEYYNKLSDKNLYVGLPKYDVVIDKEEVSKKYMGTNSAQLNKKIALILYPRLRDVNSIDIERIYELLRFLDFALIVKTRGKDIISNEKHYGDLYIEDYSWYPHTTMELLKIANLVINFDSCAIKECVMAKVPIINYNIKPERKLEFLYDYKFAYNISSNMSSEYSRKQLELMMTTDLNSEFELAIKNHMFNNVDVCKKILDVIL